MKYTKDQSQRKLKFVPWRVNPEKREIVWVPRPKAICETQFVFQSPKKNSLKKFKKTSFQELNRYAKDQDLEPDLLVFHLGRTGSTLLTESLRCVPNYFVYGEPPPFGSLHRLLDSSKWSDEYKFSITRGLTNSFAASQPTSAQKTIFKFSTLTNYDLRFFIKAFPRCPYIFLHREPEAMLLSYLRGAPRFMAMPYEIVADVDTKEVSREYLRFVVQHLKSLYMAIEEDMDERVIVLNYDQLTVKGVKALFHHLDYPWSRDLEGKIKKQFRVYSKDTGRKRKFTGDRNPQELIDLVKEEKSYIEKNLRPYYKKFEKKKLILNAAD